jgi:hypothetical protein
MAQTIRVSLPGYDALSDTNPDHYALYADSDFVLIKEKERGSATIPYDGSNPYEITHNLGYVPFFLVYAFDTNARLDPNAETNKWKLVPSPQLTVVTPPFYCYADTTKLYIWNLDFPNDTDFKWYIFYDNVVGSSSTVSLSSSATLRVTKQGYDALTETDPNNYIFLSDFNTFKILKEATSNITYTADGRYSISHGISGYSTTSFVLFLQFPDGYSAPIVGTGKVTSRDGAFVASDAFIDATTIQFYLERISGSATALKAKYYIFETPL